MFRLEITEIESGFLNVVFEKLAACCPGTRISGAIMFTSLSKGCHLDVVRGPSTPHDPESDAGGSLSSWQGHPSR
jgi:hypothetical protein